MKRIFCILLSLVLLFSAVPSTVVSAKGMTKTFEKDEVMQMGSFDSLSNGFIVYYPTELEEADKKFPAVVWANGTMCPPAMYYKLLIGIAKAGYIVIASPEMMPKDGTAQIAAIDYILSENEKISSPFYNKVDTQSIGAIGHSQGGAGSVNAAAADKRIKAIVSIAGASTKKEAKNLDVPSLFLAGENDYIVLPSLWVKQSYKACNAPAVYALLNDGIHTSCMIKEEAYLNYIIKWCNAWLSENGEKAAFLDGGELSNDENWSDFKTKNFDANGATQTTQDDSNGLFEFVLQLLKGLLDIISQHL